jgi:hypothetical protein
MDTIMDKCHIAASLSGRHAVASVLLKPRKEIHRMAVCIYFLAVTFAFPSLLQAADLFVVVPRAQVDALKSDRKLALGNLEKQKTTKSLSIIKIDTEVLRQDSVTLPIRSNLRLQAKVNKVDRRSNTDFTWYGNLSEAPGEAILVVQGDQVTGTIRSGKSLYRIRSLGGGFHALIEVNESGFPPDEPPSFKQKERQKSERSESPPQDTRKADTAATIVEVLVAYTPSAESADGNIAGTIQLAVDETNKSYENSGINIRLHLAQTLKVNYRESGSSFDMILNHFASAGDGRMDEIHKLRGTYKSDVAVLLINQSAFCGLARTIKAAALSGFAIVHYDCATGNYSFGHEIGHLQGARHNPEVDNTSTPFAYGHGYLNGSNWRTIMAYNCSPSCPRLQYWSNPNVKYGGVAMGTTSTHNNARVLNETRSTVAAFRPTTGAIWRYTGTPCSGNSCPGWQRLDNNPKTVAIVAGGNSLYQLHNDGWIWRFTGTPCSGNSCPGWQRLDNNLKTIAIVAAGSSLYQLHDDGWIWRSTGTPCSGNSCPGWQRLDNNPMTETITGDAELYQLH